MTIKTKTFIVYTRTMTKFYIRGGEGRGGGVRKWDSFAHHFFMARLKNKETSKKVVIGKKIKTVSIWRKVKIIVIQ